MMKLSDHEEFRGILGVTFLFIRIILILLGLGGSSD